MTRFIKIQKNMLNCLWKRKNNSLLFYSIPSYSARNTTNTINTKALSNNIACPCTVLQATRTFSFWSRSQSDLNKKSDSSEVSPSETSQPSEAPVFPLSSEDLPQPNILIDPSAQSVVSQVLEVYPTLADLSYWPTDLVVWGIEFLHASFGFPYWQAILVGTACLRIPMFPISAKMMRSTAKMTIMKPDLEKLTSKMKNDPDKSVVKQSYYHKEMQALMKKHGSNPFTGVLMLLIQMPVFLSCFFGLQKLGDYVDLTNGGALWFTDLSAADPTYLLPVLCSATFLGMGELGGALSPESGSAKTFMRVAAVASLPFTLNVPQGVLLYWSFSNCVQLIQQRTLKTPWMKTFFDIPEIPEHIKKLSDAQDPLAEYILPIKKLFGLEQNIPDEVLFGKTVLKKGEAISTDRKTVVKVSSTPPAMPKKEGSR